jgi:hypothetical protein
MMGCWGNGLADLLMSATIEDQQSAISSRQLE